MLSSVETKAACPDNSNVTIKGRISVESVRRVFARLEPSEAQRFENDLRAYGRTGEQSEFLLSVLADAAKEMRDQARLRSMH